MKAVLNWKSGMQFEAVSDGNTIITDAKAPLGKGSGMTPKEMVAAGTAGCTAIDVVAWLKKHKQDLKGLTIDTDVQTSTGVYPAVFTRMDLKFNATGEIDKNILIEAVRLSQTKYCGVSAMLSKAFPIYYEIYLNNEKVAEGQADFSA